MVMDHTYFSPPSFSHLAVYLRSHFYSASLKKVILYTASGFHVLQPP